MRSMIDETSSASRWNTPHESQMPRRFETSFTPYDASEKKSNAAELSAEKELRCIRQKKFVLAYLLTRS
eukprot:scaffold7227_cov90-Skeletonema_marinoi.AAC.4